MQNWFLIETATIQRWNKSYTYKLSPFTVAILHPKLQIDKTILCIAT